MGNLLRLLFYPDPEGTIYQEQINDESDSNENFKQGLLFLFLTFIFYIHLSLGNRFARWIYIEERRDPPHEVQQDPPHEVQQDPRPSILRGAGDSNH